MASSKEIPPWGRSEKHLIGDIQKERSPKVTSTPQIGTAETFSADVPLNNTGPTVVRGTLIGDMPNWPRMARGRLISQKGKYSKPVGPPFP